MARKMECIAMLLAGGQGSRLGILTKNIAKPAVPYGGKYRIIDFPLSNCVNSGISTVGVLTQYQPLELNDYIGNGQPWDLTAPTAGCISFRPISRLKVRNGIKARQTPFTKISTLSTATTPNMWRCFRATIFIKWTIPKCLNTTKKRTRRAQSPCWKSRGKRLRASA